VTARRGSILLAAFLFAAPPAHAQSAPDVLARGIGAYNDLSLEDAAPLLRRSLQVEGGGALTTWERVRALTYLGATEVLRRSADSAVAAFQRLLFLDPRNRPDPLIFPPEVTDVFEAVLRQTKVVVARVPPETDLQLSASDRFSAWVFASSPHEFTAEVTYDDGRLARTLYTGPIGDSLGLQWNGRDETGQVVTSGRYLLNMISRDPAGRLIRLYRVPLDVDLRLRDTLPHPEPPADSVLLPEAYTSRPGLEALFGGLAVGVAIVALPAAFSPEADLSNGRFAIAGALSLAGVAGFVTRRPGSPIGANIRANTGRRQAWQDALLAVQEENAGRRRDVRLVIRSGPAVRIEGTGR
jgi:hypothetical protein